MMCFFKVKLNNETVTFFKNNRPCGGSPEDTVKAYTLRGGTPQNKAKVYISIGGSPRENL